MLPSVPTTENQNIELQSGMDQHFSKSLLSDERTLCGLHHMISYYSIVAKLGYLGRKFLLFTIQVADKGKSS